MKISFSGLIGGLICIGIGCALLVATWWSYVDYSRLKSYDGQTTAYITKKYTRTATDGRVQHCLDYSFASAAGKKIDVSATVSRERWNAFQVKDSLEIRYDPSDPSRHLPIYEPGSSPAFAFFMLIMGAVFLAFGGSRLFYSFEKRKTGSRA